MDQLSQENAMVSCIKCFLKVNRDPTCKYPRFESLDDLVTFVNLESREFLG